MFSWAGAFKVLTISLLSLGLSIHCIAEINEDPKVDTEGRISWEKYSQQVEELKKSDFRIGLSYIISGSIALGGGILGENLTKDSVERGIYTVFQSIGVASVGYGAYVWKVGGEERSLYDTLALTKGLSSQDKSKVLRAFYFQKKRKEKQERIIKAITHGLVAGLNIYNGSRQNQDGVKNTLMFIGGVNLLAALSYSIDF